jgi:hypothetical protein
VFSVVSRCFQIVQSRVVQTWREASDIVIAPEVSSVGWNSFSSAADLIRAGELAARDAFRRHADVLQIG